MYYDKLDNILGQILLSWTLVAKSTMNFHILEALAGACFEAERDYSYRMGRVVKRRGIGNNLLSKSLCNGSFYI